MTKAGAYAGSRAEPCGGHCRLCDNLWGVRGSLGDGGPDMTDDADILFERRGVLGLITLNRPQALNALTHGMCVRLQAQLDAWQADPLIATIAIQGAGERAFCAGGDLACLLSRGLG